MKAQVNTRGLTTPELIQLAQDIHTNMTGNASFPTPVPTLAALQAQIDATQAALDAADMAFAALRMKRTERRAAAAALVGVLESLVGYVQAASAGDEAVILSSGMSVRQPPQPVLELTAPENLRATPNGMEGVVKVEWDTVRGADSYLVECATAPTGPFTQTNATSRARAEVPALTPGTRYYFRVRAVGAPGEGPWSDIAMKMAA